LLTSKVSTLFRTGEAVAGTICATLAGDVAIVTVRVVSTTSLIETDKVALVVPGANLSVMHVSEVDVVVLTVHYEPSLNLRDILVPSVALYGRFDPRIVSVVPPNGFKLELGVIEVTVRPTLITSVVEIGMRPLSSVTRGCQEPATGVTEQVMVVGSTTAMLVHLTLENLIDLTTEGR